MAAALTQIRAFINTYSGYNFEELTNDKIESLKSFASQSFQTILYEIQSDFELLTNDVSKKQYISSLQSQLVYLDAGLNGFNRQPAEPKPLIIEWVCKEIYFLLEHLRIYFYRFLDIDIKLPPNYVATYRIEHPEIWQDFERFFSENHIDPELQALLTQFANSTESTEKFTINNWQQFEYLLQMVQEVGTLSEHIDRNIPELAILKLFVFMEFNSIQVYGYFIKYIERITMNEGSFQEQQQDLLYLLKVFRQVRIDAKYPYDPLVQSLKLSVTESIETEITYLEQKEKMLLESFRGPDPGAPSKFYFKVVFTLAELMFFFRIMLEVKVIYTKFNSYIYEFIANHIQTERAENISKKSMRNHISSKLFPDRVVQNVKTWLEKMIQHINLYYHI